MFPLLWPFIYTVDDCQWELQETLALPFKVDLNDLKRGQKRKEKHFYP